MDVIKKFFVLLAIFCVIGSAAAVCAADVGDDLGAQALNQSDDFDGGWAGSQYNETLENATANATNATDVPANTTAPVAGNANNATAAHTMLATGNPILALLAVSAVLGGCAIYKRK